MCIRDRREASPPAGFAPRRRPGRRGGEAVARAVGLRRAPRGLAAGALVSARGAGRGRDAAKRDEKRPAPAREEVEPKRYAKGGLGVREHRLGARSRPGPRPGRA